jgi:hypothetical protein
MISADELDPCMPSRNPGRPSTTKPRITSLSGLEMERQDQREETASSRSSNSSRDDPADGLAPLRRGDIRPRRAGRSQRGCVEVTGLPSDVVAHVEVTGPEEYREPVDADDPAQSAVPRPLR